MLDAHQLNVFLVSADTLNFTEAAHRLHMSQPSVSQHIQSLEQQFGLALFNRAGRHLELTDAGIALVPLAREMVSRSIQIKETMESLKGEVYGHLTVGCSTTPGKYVLPQLLAAFHRYHGRVKVTCQVAPQKDSLQMLCEGEVHFALASEYLVSCKDVEFRKFMTDPVILICPLDHPWATRGEIEPDELRDAEFIMREENSGTRMIVRKALDEHNIAESELETLLTLGNSEAIAIAVQEGIGVGFVSSLVFTRLVQGRVATVKIRGMNIERDIYIGRNIRVPASTAQTAFWSFISNDEMPLLNLELDEQIHEQKPVF